MAIETRTTCGRRHGHAQFFPIPFRCEAKLLDGRPEYVVGYAYPAIGQNDAFGRQRAMREVAALAVQFAQAREDVLDDKQGRFQVNRLPRRLGPDQQLGKTDAPRVVVDEPNTRQPPRYPDDVADRQKGRMIELLDQPEALVEREFKRRHRRQLAAKKQVFM
jgi:hypothetical protein